MNKNLIILFLIFQTFYLAQDLPVRIISYSSDDPLSRITAKCMVQDRYGFLWIGTEDGLNRYDGYELTAFKQNPSDSNSIVGNYIVCLLEDTDGILWIGSLGGLTAYNNKTGKFTQYKPDKNRPDWLQGDNVISLFEDREGIIWMGTYLGGFSSFDKKRNKFKTFFNDSNDLRSISNNTVIPILEDKDGIMWLGTFGGGLNKFDRHKNEFSHFYHDPDKNSVCSNVINTISEDAYGNLVMGTSRGLSIYYKDDNRFENFFIDPDDKTDFGSNYIHALFKDKTDNIWIRTIQKGLILFDQKNKKFNYFSKKNNPDQSVINDNFINSIYEDNNGILWIGTGASGLIKLVKKNKNFHNITKATNKISDNCTISVYEETNGNLWLGTTNGLNKIDFRTRDVSSFFYNPDDQNSLSNNMVWEIAGDNSGNVWIGTQSGLNKYIPGKKNFKRFLNDPLNKQSIPFNIMRSLHCSKNGIIWIGTWGGGLIKFDPSLNKFTSFTYNIADSNSISNDIVFYINEDERGNLWLCTSVGFNMFNPETEKFTRFFNKNNNALPLAFSCLYQDSGNIFWLGTFDGGLVKFNPFTNKFENFNEKNGLASNVIYGILPDSKGNLWISTIKGISKFNKQTKKFINYDIKDGLSSSEYSSCSFFKSKSGLLYFGGGGGLTYFHPDSIKDNFRIPQIVITKFKVFEKDLFGNKTLSDGDKIFLDHSQNFFSFEFSALDFTEPSKNQYAYLLEGVDKDWIYSAHRRYAAYTHLNPGSYNLRVKASNSDGIWNEKGISISVIISPPYWQTWWFRILSAFIILSLVGTGYLKRINALKKEKIAQEKFSKQLIESQEYERKRIAGELHDGIGQNLLIIKNRARMGINKPMTNEMLNQLELISGMATESINDVRNIAYNLHPYHLDEVGLTSTINSMLNKFCESSTIKFTSFIENIDNIFPSDVEINIFRIIQESINNIIKHSEASEAVVSISKEEEEIKIIVSDNGKGFNQKTKSSGLGLKGISERVKYCSGSLNLESLLDKGTTIKMNLKLPTKNTKKHERGI